jgi:dynein heavy chain
VRSQEYDKDNIPPAIVASLAPFMDKSEFQPEVVQKASKAAYGLCQWARAMEAYDRVAKVSWGHCQAIPAQRKQWASAMEACGRVAMGARGALTV